MEVIKSKAKKWGSSIGIIIPKDVVEREKIKEGQDIEIFLKKPVSKKTAEQIRLDWENLSKEVSKKWKGPSAVEEIREQRTKRW